MLLVQPSSAGYAAQCAGPPSVVVMTTTPSPQSLAHSLQEHVKKSDPITSPVDNVKYWLNAASQSPVDPEAVPQQMATFSSDTTSTRHPRSATSRSRSSSPSILSSQNYRAQVLSRLHIRIDADVPESTKAKLLPPVLAVHRFQHSTMMADNLQRGSRELV
jgi:hypothetical protein